MFGRSLRRRIERTPSWLTELPAALGDGMYALDHRFRFTYVNPFAEAFWGKAADALMNRSIWDMFPHFVGGLAHSAHLDALRDRKPAVFEEQSSVDDRWVSGRAHPHRGGLLVLFRDITDFRRNAAKLHECHSRLESLYDQSAIGIAEADLDGRVVRANDRMCRSFGLTRQTMLSEQLAQLLPSGAARLDRVRDGADPDTAEIEVGRPGMGPGWLETTLSLIRDADGHPDTFLLVAHDLTHRRAAEDALRRMNALLETRIAEALGSRAEVEENLRQAQKMEALGQLAGGVAHDFNNVLQAITGGARLILRKPNEPAAVTRLASLVVEAAERGAGVTRRLLSFARRDSLSAEPIEAGPMLADLADVLVHTLGRRIVVRSEAEERLMTLADRGQLEAVLVNLATNARDAMPNGGTLMLSAAAESVRLGEDHRANLTPGDYVRFTVSDNGDGMDEQTLAHAAEPFFTTKPRGKGTGLGLSMARGFAEQSDGRLCIASGIGQGTTVELWLPVAKRVADDPPPEPKPPPLTRVLVVDDDAAVRNVLVEELRSLSCEVTPHENAEAALQWLNAGGVADVIVSDLSMPGTDGLTMIREAQRQRPGLPAILLTGYAGEALDVAMGSAFSAPITLLRKPVRAADLAAALAALVRGIG